MEYDKLEDESRPETTTSAEQFDQKAFFTEHLHRSSDGSYEVKGDDLGPLELALLETEKRRRGSQATISREQAKARRAEIELAKVKEAVPKVQVTQVDEALRYSDPDEYIKQTLDARGGNPYDEVFNTASQQAADEAGHATVEGEIAFYNEEHPDTQITAEMLEMDLPPRLIREFSEGKLHPQDFLSQAADILYRPTETANQTIPVTPDLGAVGGSTTAESNGSNDKLLDNYANAVF